MTDEPIYTIFGIDKADDIVDRLTEWASIGWDAQVDPLQKHTDDTLDHDLSEAAGEIVRLRAEVARKADYAERMDALAEERLIECNRLRAEVERLTDEMSTMHRSVVHQCCEDVQAERALADQLAEELRANHDTSNPTSVECPSCVALTAYEAARKEEQ